MSNANLDVPGPAVDHMIRLLQMNPIQEGDAIIAARSSLLQLAKTPTVATAAAVNSQEDRRQLLERLEQIRATFWSTPVEKLKSELASLRGRGFADIEVAVKRLEVVAASKPTLLALLQPADASPVLFDPLKQVLVSSPRETSALKERLVGSLSNRGQRKHYRRILKRIKTDAPAVYQLEHEWFDLLSRTKGYKPQVVVKGGTGGGQKAGNYWWVVIVVVALGRVVASLGDKDPQRIRQTDLTPYYQNMDSSRAAAEKQLRDYQSQRAKNAAEEIWKKYRREHPVPANPTNKPNELPDLGFPKTESGSVDRPIIIPGFDQPTKPYVPNPR